MSRIGKQPVPIPESVKVNVRDGVVTVASADGKKTLSQATDMVTVAVEGDKVVLTVVDDSRTASARQGLYRTLVANMIEGVSKGWSKRLEISGAGYKAEKQGGKLLLTVGYTFPREFLIPAGIDIELPTQTIIVVSGIDKALVGQTAASIRSVRPPDPYKGKGIRYRGEHAVKKTAKGK